MLKGKMKIELTDVNTGKTETVLEENMVTDALTQLFRPLGLAKDPAKWLNSFAPYYKTLTGGLLLFDNEIPESPAQYYPPIGANLVGCAVYNEQNNTMGTLRGGFNQTESELNLKDRYMKYVYDFTTSQANGAIACVCLSHVNGGYNSYGGKDAPQTSKALAISVGDGTLQYAYSNYTGADTGDKYSGFTVAKTELLFLIDRETDSAYYFRIDSVNGITIIRRRAYLKAVSLLENPYNQKAHIEETVISLNTPLPSTSYVSYFFDTADSSLYVVSSEKSTLAPNASVLITKIHALDWKVTQRNLTNTSSVTLGTSGTRFAAVHNGYLFLRLSATPYDLYKFEIGNEANCVKLKDIDFTTFSGTPAFAINGRIYYEYPDGSSTCKLYVVNTEKNEIMHAELGCVYNTGRAYCYTPVLNEPMLWFASAGNYTTGDFVFLANYLATINNLSDPVTKTADKTMKVTYIIQEQ